MSNNLQDFLNKIQPLDVYNDLDLNKFPLDTDTQGWCGHGHILEKYVDLAKPNLIIEVGTWKGLSAIIMAKKLKSLDLESKVLCIDTWLGASEHWDDMFGSESNVGMVQYMEHGMPLGLYYQFLANVIRENVTDYIVPLPSTSRSAAEILALNSIKADLIYIDASHIYEEVLDDCNNYSKLLNDKGYMIFDDYSDTWQGVKQAVDIFLQFEGDTYFEIETFGPCKVIQKIEPQYDLNTEDN